MADARVLIVEDEPLIAMALEDDLQDLGYEVTGTAETADDAERLAHETSPDVILMDIRLKGDRDGVDAALSLRDDGHPARVIFVTGSREPDTLDRIGDDHPAALLIKPVPSPEIDRAIREALESPPPSDGS